LKQDFGRPADAKPRERGQGNTGFEFALYRGEAVHQVHALGLTPANALEKGLKLRLNIQGLGRLKPKARKDAASRFIRSACR